MFCFKGKGFGNNKIIFWVKTLELCTQLHEEIPRTISEVLWLETYQIMLLKG